MDSSRANAVHGTLVNVDGTGVFIVGPAGIGKSECALELVSKGHRLVADDVVEMSIMDGALHGSAPERFAGLLEIRDLGILDVRLLFGIDSFDTDHRVDLCIELSDRERIRDRIENEVDRYEISGVEIPKFEISTGRDRNISLMVETAAKIVKNGDILAENELINAHDSLILTSAKSV